MFYEDNMIKVILNNIFIIINQIEFTFKVKKVTLVLKCNICIYILVCICNYNCNFLFKYIIK